MIHACTDAHCGCRCGACAGCDCACHALDNIALAALHAAMAKHGVLAKPATRHGTYHLIKTSKKQGAIVAAAMRGAVTKRLSKAVRKTLPAAPKAEAVNKAIANQQP